MKKWMFQQSPWCRCRAPSLPTQENTVKSVPWKAYVCEAMNAVKDVVLDVQDVLQIRAVSEIDRCSCK